MKKILLGSTALLGAIALSGAASAQQVTTKAPFTLNIAGSFSSYLGVLSGGNQSLTQDKKNYDFVHESVLQFNATAKSDNGLTYGAVVRKYFQPASGPQPGGDYDRSFLFVTGSFGQVRFGDVNTARADFSPGFNAVGPALGNTLGSDGGLAQNFYNLPAAATSGIGGLPSMGNYPVYPGSGSSQRRTKLVYVSPDFSGFQAGIGYIPSANGSGFAFDRVDTSAAGQGVAANAGRANYRDMIEVSARYTFMLGGVKVIPTASYLFGSALKAPAGSAKLDDASSLYVGLSGEIAGFGAAVGYTNSFKTGVAKNTAANASPNRDDAQGFLVQAGYTFGPWAVSGFYSWATSEGNTGAAFAGNDKLSIAELAAGYTLAPGLQLWTAVHNYEFKDEDRTKFNGTVFLLGTTVSF